MSMLTDIEDIIKIHNQACKENKNMFIHPYSGFSVMTKIYLEKRECCGNKCLFCPYFHRNVKNHICIKDTCPVLY